MNKKTKSAAIGMLFAFATISVFGAELEEGLRAIQSARYSDALKILVPLANSGNDEAQRAVGEMCYNGQGMKRDMVASFKWNEIAAEGGNKIAQYNLGYLYEKGEGVTASRARAIEWYTKAALQGYTLAQHKLGDIYASTDRNKAIYWYDSAQQRGDDVARKKFSALSSEREREYAEKAREYEESREQAREQAAEQARRDEENRRREREARAEEARQSSHEANIDIGTMVQKSFADNNALLAPIQNQTNQFLAEQATRDRQANQERERARAEQNSRAAEQHREAERDRAARAEAQRTAREEAARSAHAENTRSNYDASSTTGGGPSYSNSNRGGGTEMGSASTSKSTQWRDGCGTPNVDESGSFKTTFHDKWWSAGRGYQDADLGRCQTRREIEAQAHSAALNKIRSLTKSNGDPIIGLTIAEERFVCDNNSYLKGWNCVVYVTTKTSEGKYFVPSVLNNY